MHQSLYFRGAEAVLFNELERASERIPEPEIWPHRPKNADRIQLQLA